MKDKIEKALQMLFDTNLTGPLVKMHGEDYLPEIREMLTEIRTALETPPTKQRYSRLYYKVVDEFPDPFSELGQLLIEIGREFNGGKL